MLRTKYRGYTISQQQEFGPLKLLKWVEDGDFIVVRNNGNVMRGTTFHTADDAKKAIDLELDALNTLRRLKSC